MRTLHWVAANGDMAPVASIAAVASILPFISQMTTKAVFRGKVKFLLPLGPKPKSEGPAVALLFSATLAIVEIG
jgi:hypothetical protein